MSINTTNLLNTIDETSFNLIQFTKREIIIKSCDRFGVILIKEIKNAT